jgi:L-aminopeptidase/D-esterase-like protein
MKLCRVILLAVGCALLLTAQNKPRARDLGVPFEGAPGPLNSIVDVAGVEVGHKTLISGNGKLQVGVGPVRTGVTAIWPRGKQSSDPVFGAWFAQNGNGEMTGTPWLEESGFADGPVLITNTHSVGVVRDSFLGWLVKNQRRPGTNVFPGGYFTYPIVAETYDGFLNDTNGFHVKPEHVAAALEGASSGPVAEGNVGGGTGMVCYGFKGGIGTSSRKLPASLGGYTVGVLVQSNFGGILTINGAPVGRELGRYYLKEELAGGGPGAQETTNSSLSNTADGSIIIVIATDAPIDHRNLQRLAARAMMGLARTGAAGSNGSGDYAIAFSTAEAVRLRANNNRGPQATQLLSNEAMSPLFLAVIEATEEAIYNSLFRATTISGRGHTAEALPIDRTLEILRKYNALKR